MDQISILIEFLRAKHEITELQKDILDTWNEYQKNPIDEVSAKHQISSNNGNHKEIFAKITALPTTISKPSERIDETDLSYILSRQLIFLVEKEMEINNGHQ